MRLAISRERLGHVANEAFVALVVALQAGVLAPWFASGRGVGDGLVLQGAFGLAYAVAGLLLLVRVTRRRRVRISWWLLWLLLFLGLAATSSLWSELPGLTLRRVAALAGTLVFAVWVANTMDARRLMRSVAVGLIAIAAASYLMLALAPQLAIHSSASAHAGNWRGALLHKNLLGREMALATTLTLGLAVVAPRRQRLAWLGVATLTAVLVLGARSATGIALLVAGTGTVVLLAVPAVGARERMGRGVIVATAIIAALSLIGAFGWMALDVLGRDATFTGRDRLWQVTAEQLRGHVWTGYGYGAFWDASGGAEVSRRLGYTVGHAHNGLLQAATSLGIPGVALVLTLYLGALWRALRAPAFAAARPLVVGFLVHFALLSVTDAVMSGPNSLSLTVAVALVLMRPRDLEDCRRASSPVRGGSVPTWGAGPKHSAGAPPAGAAP